MVSSPDISRGLARRAAELAGSGESVAACPEFFLERIGLTSGFKKMLQAHLSRLRDAERMFYGTITTRLHLLVKRQALDREGWDFLLACRDSLRAMKPSCDLPENGLRVPAASDERLGMIARFAWFYQKEPALEAPERGVTAQRALELLKNGEAFTREAETLNQQLGQAAARMENECQQIESLLQSMRSAVIQNLGRRDPRWTGASVQSTSADESASRLFGPLSAAKLHRSCGAARPGQNLFAASMNKGSFSMSIMAALSMLLPSTGNRERPTQARLGETR